MIDEADDPRPWEVLSSRYLSRKPWLTLREDRVRLPNGTVIEDYNVLEYPDWINVVALTTDQRMVLIRQYRHGSRAVHYELPAGVCDPSDSDPETTARRELLEETGYGGGCWSPQISLSANPGTHANLTHSFLAEGVVLQQAPTPESTEDLRVHLATLDEVLAIVKSGGVLQSLHTAAILFHKIQERP
ncbi:NUDIX hydrolase [Paludisphaera rhizosphaerae]|uniref:NUDIX hydrolase n=1 Tax=Paludisphaera rhizosphaerae TaxID=2711216 RepID=UPI0013EACDF0|nr:NUDIX hydrolase [Paludisphaera rhizosphaerae]